MKRSTGITDGLKLPCNSADYKSSVQQYEQLSEGMHEATNKYTAKPNKDPAECKQMAHLDLASPYLSNT